MHVSLSPALADISAKTRHKAVASFSLPLAFQIPTQNWTITKNDGSKDSSEDSFRGHDSWKRRYRVFTWTAFLGRANMYTTGAEQARVHDLKDCAEILDVFQKFGHNEIDTALVYGAGSSEQYLGQLDWQKRGLIMDTKFSPRAKRGDGSGTTLTHSPEDLRIALKRSLESLKSDKVDMFYLHAPDRSVPYDVTMEEVNNLYKQGRLGERHSHSHAKQDCAQATSTASVSQTTLPGKSLRSAKSATKMVGSNQSPTKASTTRSIAR